MATLPLLARLTFSLRKPPVVSKQVACHQV
jgi:hypothetical protein